MDPPPPRPPQYSRMPEMRMGERTYNGQQETTAAQAPPRSAYVSLRGVLLALCCVATLATGYLAFQRLMAKVDHHLAKIDAALETSERFMEEGIRTFKIISAASANVSHAGRDIAASLQGLNKDTRRALRDTVDPVSLQGSLNRDTRKALQDTGDPVSLQGDLDGADAVSLPSGVREPLLRSFLS